MSRARQPGALRAAGRGQATVEYALITVVLAMSLLAPWVAGDSVTAHLARIIADRWRAFATLIAIG